MSEQACTCGGYGLGWNGYHQRGFEGCKHRKEWKREEVALTLLPAPSPDEDAWHEVKQSNERADAAQAKLRIVRADIEDVWYWQGDGGDHPASLSCPAVMSADTLRAFVARLTEQAAEIARLTRYGLPWPSNSPPFHTHTPALKSSDPWATACGRRVPLDAIVYHSEQADCPECLK